MVNGSVGDNHGDIKVTYQKGKVTSLTYNTKESGQDVIYTYAASNKDGTFNGAKMYADGKQELISAKMSLEDVKKDVLERIKPAGDDITYSVSGTDKKKKEIKDPDITGNEAVTKLTKDLGGDEFETAVKEEKKKGGFGGLGKVFNQVVDKGGAALKNTFKDLGDFGDMLKSFENKKDQVKDGAESLKIAQHIVTTLKEGDFGDKEKPIAQNLGELIKTNSTGGKVLSKEFLTEIDNIVTKLAGKDDQSESAKDSYNKLQAAIEAAAKNTNNSETKVNQR